MPVTYTIDKDDRTIYVEAYGEITVEDLIENEMRIISDPQLEREYCTYADFAKAKPSHTVDIEKIRMSKEFVESIQDKRGKCKWAIYAPDDTAYAFSSMFAILSMGLHIDTKVFREKDKALEWLNIETGT